MAEEDEKSALSTTQAKILKDVQAMRGESRREPAIELHVRIKNPGKARKADYEGSRAHAIDLNCYACVGGSKSDVKDCRSYGCAFWIFRPGATSTVRPPGVVPTLSQYAELLDAKTSDGQREAAKKNAERLRKPRAGDDATDEGDDE